MGNEWRSDDGAGLEVARRLRAAGARAVEREGEPIDLIDVWADEPETTVIDAVSSGAEPGTIHRVDAGQARLPAELFRGSTHALGVAEAVELARALGRLPPRLTLIGIEGVAFTAGKGLTSAVEDAVARVVRELLGEY